MVADKRLQMALREPFRSIQFTFISINKVKKKVTVIILRETLRRTRLLVEQDAP